MFGKKINKLRGVFDEKRVKYKGHLGFPHYLPANSFFTLMHAPGRGFGKEKGPAQRVVMDLCKPLFGKNLSVYMDLHQYRSPEEFTWIYMSKEYMPARSNGKGLLKFMLPKRVRLQKHQYKVAQNHEFCVLEGLHVEQFLFCRTFEFVWSEPSDSWEDDF